MPDLSEEFFEEADGLAQFFGSFADSNVPANWWPAYGDEIGPTKLRVVVQLSSWVTMSSFSVFEDFCKSYARHLQRQLPGAKGNKARANIELDDLKGGLLQQCESFFCGIHGQPEFLTKNQRGFMEYVQKIRNIYAHGSGFCEVKDFEELKKKLKSVRNAVGAKGPVSPMLLNHSVNGQIWFAQPEFVRILPRNIAAIVGALERRFDSHTHSELDQKRLDKMIEGFDPSII